MYIPNPDSNPNLWNSDRWAYCVRDVISNSAQTLHALRVLRAHGMPDEALQVVFRSVVVGRLLYASCAWSGSGVVNAADSVLRIWRHTMIC